MDASYYMKGKVKICKPGRNTYANKEDIPKLLEEGWKLGWGPKQPDVLCSRCGKPIYRYGNKTGMCKSCFIETGYMKHKWTEPEYRNKVITNMSKPRGAEFAAAQSARTKQYYREHPERRAQQGQVFSRAWREGKHNPNYTPASYNRSKPETMMYSAFVKLFGDQYVSRMHVQGPDKRWCYPDVLLFDRIVIEYFGDYYHGNPKYYGPNDVVSYEYIAKDVWEHDKDRIHRILKSVPGGYIPPEDCCPVSEVIVIWESDVSHLQTQEDWNKYINDRFCGYDEILSV